MFIEHANITVNDIDRATQFLVTAFPSLQIRGQGPRAHGGLWRHLGTEQSYIALQQEAQPHHSEHQTYQHIGINHLCFVVSDIQSLSQRLISAGYQINDAGVEEQGRTSVYFHDDSAIEWEFVQYHSDDARIRNNYNNNE